MPRKAKRPKRPKRPIDARGEALARVVVDAPLDPLARMVLGDHLQGLGERLGDWVALAAGLEADPANARLRAASVAFVDEHRDALFGDGAELLAGAWIGWRGGFIDELRLQPYPGATRTTARVAALLAHPSCRFVRTIALGAFPAPKPIIAAIAAAAPPLLERFVALDTPTSSGDPPSIDAIAALPTLRQLGLRDVAITVAMPQITTLVVSARGPFARYLAAGKCPNLEELVVEDFALAPKALATIVGKLPHLKRLRLLGERNLRARLVALRPHLPRLALLDVSHTPFTDGDAALLADHGDLELVAIRTDATAAPPGLRAATVTRPSAVALQQAVANDPELTSWLPQRLAAGGRDAIALIPGVGVALYNLGTRVTLDGREAVALPVLEAALTFPVASLHTFAWANAALAHERLYHFDEAERIGREGLLRAPLEPNFFAIVIDALRRSDRLDQALALVPRAFGALDRPEASRHSAGAAACCLLDCLFTLAQAGRHREVLAAAKKYPAAMKPDAYPVVAMSHVALGHLAKARAAMKRGEGAGAVKHHAHAVLALAAPTWDRASVLAEIAELHRLRYPELHWLGADPNLAAIRDELSSARA